MVNNKKAQIGVKELVLTLILAGLLFTVSLLIFANVSNSTESIFDPTLNTIINESLTLGGGGVGGVSNSTLLAEERVLSAGLVIFNFTQALVLDTDYTVTFTPAEGVPDSTANVSLINIQHNETSLFARYNFNTVSGAQASNTIVQTTVLDSFSLGVIALIVLAAVVILGVLFTLGA